MQSTTTETSLATRRLVCYQPVRALQAERLATTDVVDACAHRIVLAQTAA